MLKAMRLAAIAALIAPASAFAAQQTGTPMRAIAIVADSPDSMAGQCRGQLQEELIAHGFRIVAPERADVLLTMYGNDEDVLTGQLRDTYRALRVRKAALETNQVVPDSHDEDRQDAADEILDELEEMETNEVAYEYQLTVKRTGEMLAYGSTFESSGSTTALCADIADDIGDAMQKDLNTTIVIRQGRHIGSY